MQKGLVNLEILVSRQGEMTLVHKKIALDGLVQIHLSRVVVPSDCASVELKLI